MTQRMWTASEERVIASSSETAYVLARMLKRTPGSIKFKRKQLRSRGVYVVPAKVGPPFKRASVRCCSSHSIGSIGVCCDPDDCGPCCEKCPTCPTLHIANIRRLRNAFLGRPDASI